MAVRMKQYGVYEDELRQLAASINFEIKSDDDLIRLFHEAKKLGFWPNLDIPRPNKDTLHALRIMELKPLFFEKRVKGSYLNASWEEIWGDGTHKSKKNRPVDERLDLAKELERLTKLANALENPKFEEELDEWLNNI